MFTNKVNASSFWVEEEKWYLSLKELKINTRV